jgi:type II secretory pathway pseudopilin PulG
MKRDNDDSGFMMVVLLVAMSIAAIWMAAALPSWRQQAQRQKEDDLIFRGEQYARAIVLYQNKNRGLPPPDIDTLISQHYLRKKWKDPITGKDFTLVGPGIVSTTQQTNTTTPFSSFQPSTGSQVNVGPNQQPGITGVRSTSTATSIKIYNNQQQHNLWQFDAQTYRTLHGMGPAPTGNGQQNGGRQGGGRDTGPGGARGGDAGRGGVQQGGPGRGGGAPPPPVPVGGRGRGF